MSLRSGRPLFHQLNHKLDGFIALYFVMVVPVLVTSIIFTTATFGIPTNWPYARKRTAAIVLAFLIPLIAFAVGVLVGLSFGAIYGGLYRSAITATVVYGCCSRFDR